MEFVGTPAAEENNLRTPFSKIADLVPTCRAKHFFPRTARPCPAYLACLVNGFWLLLSMTGSPTPASWLSGLPRLTYAEGIPGIAGRRSSIISPLCVQISIPHHNLWPARCQSPTLSAAKLHQPVSNGPRSMNTIIGPPLQNSTEKSISLEQPQWTIPTCRRRRRRRLLLLLLLSSSAAPGPAVRVPREGLLAQWRGFRICQNMGPCAAEAPFS